MQLKFILQGVGVAISAAFAWLFWFTLLLYDGPRAFLTAVITAAFGLPLSGIFVVPLGGVLGLVLPGVARKSSGPKAFAVAMIFAAGVAFATTILVMLFFKTSFVLTFRTMLVVCAVFLGGWTCYLRSRRVIDSVAPENSSAIAGESPPSSEDSAR